MAALVSFPYVYNLSKRELYEKVIRDVMEGKAGNIHPDVYQAYSDNLRKAVGGVFPQGNPGDPYFDLEAQLQANVTRFAAYKAWHLTEQLKKQREKWTDDDEYKKVAKAVLNTFNRYQAAEYNTATARARTAKQWTDFNADPIANELYPNLRWLPSRSASPREEHMVFYNRVWAKTDPFWSVNQPGNLWNCKCDWEETDDPVTDGNPTGAHHAQGLEGNPAETGEIFGENCTYFKRAGGNRKERNKTENLCQNLSRNLLKKQAKSHSLLNQKTSCSIAGVEHDVVFKDYSITEFAEKMYGSRQFWLKNQIINDLPVYIKEARWFKTEEVDLSHNTGWNLRLKKKLQWFHYFHSTLPDGTPCIIEIIEYKTGEFCFYTMVKNNESSQ